MRGPSAGQAQDHERRRHRQPRRKQLQQHLTVKHATEWVEPGLALQRSYEHAQWLAEPVVTEIRETGLLHRRAEQGALVKMHPPLERRERAVQGPDGPREPRPSEVVNAVQGGHASASLQAGPTCKKAIKRLFVPPRCSLTMAFS